MDGLVFFIIFLLVVYYFNRNSLDERRRTTNVRGGGIRTTTTTDYYELVNNSARFETYRSMQQLEPDVRDIICSALNLLKRESRFVALHYTLEDYKKNSPSVGLFISPVQSFSRILDKFNVTQQDFLDERLPGGLVLFYLLVRVPQRSRDIEHAVDCSSVRENICDLLNEVAESVMQETGAEKKEGGGGGDGIAQAGTRIRYLLYPVPWELSLRFGHPLVAALRACGFRRVLRENEHDAISGSCENLCWRKKVKQDCVTGDLVYGGVPCPGYIKTDFYIKYL
jgi:hypothetical protein